MMRDYTLVISGRKAISGKLEEEAPAVQWYMFKEDRDVFGSIRKCAPCPAVMIMRDDPHAKITRQWQYYFRAINYNMTLKNVYLILDDHVAWANRTGFPTLDNPGMRQDWFFNRNIDDPTLYKPPQLDKVRTTARSVLTGVEEFDYPSYTYNNTATREPVLNVKVFDSRQLPPLKPGYSYPGDISQVNPDAYAIMPQTHPEMFLVASIVNRRGEVVQFPRGATYPWIDGGTTPYTFIPHMANLAYGPIKVPLRYLYKVPLGDPKPRAYRFD